MTLLTALGSGSRGNAFAVSFDGSVLLIDAGFTAREIARRAESAGVRLDRLCGIAITQEHGTTREPSDRGRPMGPVDASAGT